jgi:transposase
MPHQANALEENQEKRGGARVGHPGHGRTIFDESQADRVVEVDSEPGERCPEGGDLLAYKEIETRAVIDIPPFKAERTIYRWPKKYCCRCKRTYKPRIPGVLPRGLYGNQLISTVTTMHYLHGIPMGRICEQIGMGYGSLIKIFHRLAKMFTGVQTALIEQYRKSPVKHADETGWRNDGQSGYAWLFATEEISIFLFRKTRSAAVAREVLGTDPLPFNIVMPIS